MAINGFQELREILLIVQSVIVLIGRIKESFQSDTEKEIKNNGKIYDND